jgi:hypothetical protein
VQFIVYSFVSDSKYMKYSVYFPLVGMCLVWNIFRRHGLRHRSMATRLLWSWVRIPREAWMFVCCVYCQVEVSATADHSSRGVLPTVARRVWSRNLMDKEAMRMPSAGKHNRQNHNTPAHRPRNHTLYNILPIWFVFQVTRKDLRSFLMMAGYCWNM